MSHISSSPLIIVSDNQSHIAVLREACAVAFEAVRVFENFSQIKSNELDEDSFILTVISTRQHQQQCEAAVKCAAGHMVFALIEGKAEDDATFDEAVFEGVFQYPVRLGRLVEGMKNVAAQKTLHKRMASIKLGQITLDPKTSSLSYGDNVARLTEKEAAILIFLSKKNNVAVSRQNLLDEVWGYAKDVETHTLETHIYRLRQKIKTKLGLDDFLVTNDDGYILKF